LPSVFNGGAVDEARETCLHKSSGEETEGKGKIPPPRTEGGGIAKREKKRPKGEESVGTEGCSTDNQGGDVKKETRKGKTLQGFLEQDHYEKKKCGLKQTLLPGEDWGNFEGAKEGRKILQKHLGSRKINLPEITQGWVTCALPKRHESKKQKGGRKRGKPLEGRKDVK